jgi:hypothetical protein
MTDGVDIAPAITGALEAALGEGGSMREVLTKVSSSRDVGELTKHLSNAIHDPQLNQVIDSQVERFKATSEIPKPPQSGDPVPSAANLSMPSSSSAASSSSSSSSHPAASKHSCSSASAQPVAVIPTSQPEVTISDHYSGPSGIVPSSIMTGHKAVAVTDDVVLV